MLVKTTIRTYIVQLILGLSHFSGGFPLYILTLIRFRFAPITNIGATDMLDKQKFSPSWAEEWFNRTIYQNEFLI
jgi:hypothetical protein